MQFSYLPLRKYLRPRYPITTYEHPTGHDVTLIASGYNWCGKYMRQQWRISGQEPTEEERTRAEQVLQRWLEQDAQFLVFEPPNYAYCNLLGCQAAVDIAWDLGKYAAFAWQLWCCLSPGEAQTAQYHVEQGLLECASAQKKGAIRRIDVPANVQACLKHFPTNGSSALTRRQTSIIFREIWRQTGIACYWDSPFSKRCATSQTPHQNKTSTGVIAL